MAPGFGGTRGPGRRGRAGRGSGAGPLFLPAPRRPPSCSRDSVAAAAVVTTATAAAVDMEPPDAQAGTRGAPQLLVLALLLGAHPGTLGLRAGRNGRTARWGLWKGKGEVAFTHPGKPNLGTPGRRNMGEERGPSLPMRDLGTIRQRSWGHHSSGLETT